MRVVPHSPGNWRTGCDTREGRQLTPQMRRAIECRIISLEAEQAAAADEHDGLYARSDTLLAEIIERQERLFRFREILLNRGGRT